MCRTCRFIADVQQRPQRVIDYESEDVRGSSLAATATTGVGSSTSTLASLLAASRNNDDYHQKQPSSVEEVFSSWRTGACGLAFLALSDLISSETHCGSGCGTDSVSGSALQESYAALSAENDDSLSWMFDVLADQTTSTPPTTTASVESLQVLSPEAAVAQTPELQMKRQWNENVSQNSGISALPAAAARIANLTNDTKNNSCFGTGDNSGVTFGQPPRRATATQNAPTRPIAASSLVGGGSQTMKSTASCRDACVKNEPTPSPQQHVLSVEDSYVVNQEHAAASRACTGSSRHVGTACDRGDEKNTLLHLQEPSSSPPSVLYAAPSDVLRRPLHKSTATKQFLLNSGNVIKTGGGAPAIIVRAGALHVQFPPDLHIISSSSSPMTVRAVTEVSPVASSAIESRKKGCASEDVSRICQLPRAEVIEEILGRAGSSNMKELDTILSAFIASCSKSLSTVQLRQLLHVVSTVPKQRLLNWLSGQADLPSKRLSSLNSFGNDHHYQQQQQQQQQQSTSSLHQQYRASAAKLSLTGAAAASCCNGEESDPSLSLGLADTCPCGRAADPPLSAVAGSESPQWDTHFVAGQMLLSYLNVNHPRLRRFELHHRAVGTTSNVSPIPARRNGVYTEKVLCRRSRSWSGGGGRLKRDR